MRMMDSENWYALHVRSNFGFQVRCELMAKEVETYLPTYDEVHRWQDRRKTIAMPVFPGYVFARFADSVPCRLNVLKTRGVIRILGSGTSIHPVPDDEIANLQRMLSSRQRCFGHPFLPDGARVRIKRGPLRDVEGILIRVKNQARLVVSIELLSQAVATEIDACDVELAAAAHK
jgi:transcription antitermination factor NusG